MKRNDFLSQNAFTQKKKAGLNERILIKTKKQFIGKLFVGTGEVGPGEKGFQQRMERTKKKNHFRHYALSLLPFAFSAVNTDV